jgi:2-hydroxychromene-2-carboxylate isomerase
MRKPPRLYFSFRSPRSWLALRRLEERWPQAPEVVTYLPHWQPEPALREALTTAGSDVVTTGVSRAKHEYLLVDTERLVRAAGHTMVWPADVAVNWEVPHLAWLYARRQDRGAQFYRAVVRARWERGENVSDPRVLTAAAGEAGLDPAGVLGAVHDRGVRQEAVEVLGRAWDDDVFAVPYFIVGRHRFWGLGRLDGFLAAAADAGVLR